MNLPTLTIARLLPKIEFGRTQLLVAPAGAILIAVIVLVLVIWPKFTQALAIRAENQQLAVKVEVMGTKVQVLELLDRNELVEQLGDAERLLPSDKAVFSHIRQIEAVASAAGVILSKVDVAPGVLSGESAGALPPPTAQGAAPGGAPQDALEGAKVQVKISLTSDYKSLVTFLEQIMTLSRVSAVRDLTIASASATGEVAPLRTTMALDAYFRPLPKELGSIEAPVEVLTQEEEKILASVRAAAIISPVATSSAVVAVPTGRTDLFAPF